jgi:hypothetical protein
MFAKNKDGNLDPKVAESVTHAFSTIPLKRSRTSPRSKLPLAQAYTDKKATEQATFDAAAQERRVPDFRCFPLIRHKNHGIPG